MQAALQTSMYKLGAPPASFHLRLAEEKLRGSPPRAMFSIHELYQFSLHTFPKLLVSRVWLFATPWTVAHQAPLPMGFSRLEYWSG